MKKLMLSIVFCLLVFPFLKAQDASLIVSESAAVQALILPQDTSALHEYCGIYTMKSNPYIDEVKIIVKDGKLMSKTPENEEVVFEHTENDEFFIAPFSAKAIFTRINGIVKGVKVVVQGKEMVGEKK